jgi:hypothetical protein
MKKVRITIIRRRSYLLAGVNNKNLKTIGGFLLKHIVLKKVPSLIHMVVQVVAVLLAFVIIANIL